jgi:integrase
MMAMRHDPWRHQERYQAWKATIASGIGGLCPENALLVRAFLDDMEVGRNTATGTHKGGRSYARLNNLRQRLVFLAGVFERRYHALLTMVSEGQAHEYFGGMRSGTIRRLDGRAYRSTGDYVNVFKSFWHWHMKVERKQGRVVEDVCVDLDYQSEKAPWVYLTHDHVERLCAHATFEYRVLMLFLFDTGIRSPTELVNVRVRDLSHDCAQLHIREEASKTFGRTIKLLLCPDVLRSFISDQRRAPNDAIFPINPGVTNRYLRRLAQRVLGSDQSPGGKPYARLTLYDFRHSAACYWLPRYKNESALKYRFGWKKTDMIHYYTGFLGMSDTITTEDLLIPKERTEIEQQLDETLREKALLEERLTAVEQQLHDILRVVTNLGERTS